jgi:hypothetical protein
MKSLLFSLMIVSVLTGAGCSSGTKVTSSWKSPDAPSSSAAFKKVMVLAVLTDKDRSLQQSMETEMVNQLSSKGISAASAFQTYGPNRFSSNEKQAIKQLKRTGADAVMTIALLDKTKEKNYVPGNVTYQPAGIYYNRFWGYYNYSYNRLYSPGYYTTNTSYFWESNLYNLQNNKLVYSVQTESFDPSSAGSLAKDYSKKITENMMKQGVLVKQ